MAYVGRFAPSPTGPLHLGSLLAAVASYLDAKANGGQWRLRIDDIDGPRSELGAADSIQRSLEAHGLCWDGDTGYQSQSLDAYQAAMDQLQQQDLLFYCRCSRASLAAGRPYPGTCRNALAPRADAAIRLRCHEQTVRFNDQLQGQVSTDLGATCGDFIVWRRDGLPAYQLATAVDDAAPLITHVVRGNDLLDITGRQLYLMQSLGKRAPIYAHVPVLVDAHNSKLSKRTGATPVLATAASSNLAKVLKLLTLAPPAELERWPTADILAWAIPRWPDNDLSGRRQLPLTGRS